MTKATRGPSDGGIPPARRPDRRGSISRRRFLGAAGSLAGGAALAGGSSGTVADAAPPHVEQLKSGVEPFYGDHQGGIATPPQRHAQFAAFDVHVDDRRELIALLEQWTVVAAALTAGRTAPGTCGVEGQRLTDSGETVGLGPDRLTIGLGFGPSLFGLGGGDRFGIRHAWPMALVDLPGFEGDRLTEATSGGDLVVLACADDPQVAFHALRQLLRAAGAAASVRWSQAGFNERAATAGTPRDLLGFKDGTVNPRTEKELDNFVWVGGEGPDWMAGGTYLVTRRIRVDLGRWDALPVAEQEHIVGRHKGSGAPLGKALESQALDLATTDRSGRPLIARNAHVRLASSEENWGQMLLRRSYAFDNGYEQAPDGAGLDAGLLFVAFQRNPRLGFIPIFEKLSKHDALREFTTHTASAIAAFPPAARHPGDWVGRGLFEV